MQRVRLAAVDGLSELDPAYARDELVRLLHDDAVWEIRARAARALGLTGDPEVVDDLEAALDDPNEFVRSAATNALELHGDAGRAAPGDE
jgi:HEAT repeat protein